MPIFLPQKRGLAEHAVPRQTDCVKTALAPPPQVCRLSENVLGYKDKISDIQIERRI